MANGVLSSGVQVGCIQIRKGKSQADCLGLDVGHKDRIRINLLSLRLHFFEFYLVNFYFMQVVSFKNL